MTEETNRTEFTYEDWHQIWKAVEASATKYWSLVERFQIASKKNPDEDTYLWLHFLELAEQQTELLNKVEKIANEHFPVVKDKLFPITHSPSSEKPN